MGSDDKLTVNRGNETIKMVNPTYIGFSMTRQLTVSENQTLRLIYLFIYLFIFYFAFAAFNCKEKACNKLRNLIFSDRYTFGLVLGDPDWWFALILQNQ